VFGSPDDRRTWSSAPASVADGLERRGIRVTGIDTSLSRLHYAVFAGVHLLSGYGQFKSSEAIARGPAIRRFRALGLARQLKRLKIARVLHTGTLDMPPAADETGIVHYLLCDQTWHLSLRYRSDAVSYTDQAIREFEKLEHQAYARSHHIFTFGEYVRANLVSHYGVPEHRVTAVGSGMGNIQPYTGPKDYTHGSLLFIAKHLFVEKGGSLLLDAFRLAVGERPNLTLTIVGDRRSHEREINCPNVTFRPFVPWSELEALLRQATLLVQPMLNDPWGQVYLEALTSRTPVIGLNRNGLPEITRNGQFGFLVDSATPEALARAILDATSNPDRLIDMGHRGQRYVMEHYSWDRVAQRIFDVIERHDPSPQDAH
jgi:glycosyltransferase involved in cell wall biosynthesis